MATALKHKLSYHRRLFLLLLVFSWTLVGCFILFQYGREKHFKAERLDAQLQLFNLRMLDAVNAGAPPDAFIARSGAPCEGVRVTLIDPAGHVVFDNSLDTLPGANHLDRPEVAEALARGTGYTIRRHSESTDRNYFYSAMRGDRYIVRSAVPYSVPLGEILAADREFLWFMLGVTLLMSVAGYFATRRLGQNITRLNEFAERHFLTTNWAKYRATSSASTPVCKKPLPTATASTPSRCTRNRRKYASRNSSPTTSTTS